MNWCSRASALHSQYGEEEGEEQEEEAAGGPDQGVEQQGHHRAACGRLSAVEPPGHGPAHRRAHAVEGERKCLHSVWAALFNCH